MILANDIAIGVKLGELTFAEPEYRIPPRMKAPLSFLEYAAPVIDFEYLCKSVGVPPQFLLPHSVFLSTASAPPARSVLALLRAQCMATRAPYLGEHIGYLNPNPEGPSLGYIIAPPLNKQTIDSICRNVDAIQQSCGVPVALENPAIYTYCDGSSMKLDDFLLRLSDRLSDQTGWLIDFAHLKVAARNLGRPDLSVLLRTYAQTGRQIYEVHLAAVREGKFGVFHDDHRSALGEGRVTEACDALKGAGLKPRAFTIECDLEDGRSEEMLLHDIEFLRFHLSLGTRMKTSEVGDAPTPAPPHLLVSEERRGRKQILRERLLSQLLPITETEVEEVSRTSGFKDFNELLEIFLADPFASFFKTGVPYFSEHEPDGVDLTGSFYEFLRERVASAAGRRFLRRLLLEIAVKAKAVANVRGDGRHVKYLIKFDGTVDSRVRSGLYEIIVDKNDNICIIKNHGTYHGNDTRRFTEGEPLCRSLQKLRTRVPK